jgi:hypothetical protein
MTFPSAVTQVSLTREQLVSRIKPRLAAKNLTVFEARDGICDCFVSTYLGGIDAGVSALQIKASSSELQRIAEQIFKRRLVKHGATWESPNVDALERVKLEADAELHFDQLPAELSAMHDQVCSLLIGKVSGLLPHRGDKSVVTAEVRKSNEVELTLRKAMSLLLSQVSSAVENGESPERVQTLIQKLNRLNEALRDFAST